MGASILRLFFHDCFIQGCDASVLLDDDGTKSFESEKNAGPNANSLDGFHVINRIKVKVEQACGPRVVSCADILALTAKQAVVALGPAGQPTGWPVLLGRRDSRTANMAQANTDLPSPDSDLSTLIAAFRDKGFSAAELVALSGAHTVGMAHCGNVGADQPQPQKCSNVDSSALVALDEQTPGNFDNWYYKKLLSNRGLLRSDRVLTTRDDLRNLVGKYASNQTLFFEHFGKAMKRMSEMNVLTGTSGEIRSNCSRVN